jgi:hypothetical protein
MKISCMCTFNFTPGGGIRCILQHGELRLRDVYICMAGHNIKKHLIFLGLAQIYDRVCLFYA